jgi:hypothetical protein
MFLWAQDPLITGLKAKGLACVLCKKPMFLSCFVFQMENLEAKLETAKKEQEALVDAYAEEMKYRDQEEQNLRNKLMVICNSVTAAHLFAHMPRCTPVVMLAAPHSCRRRLPPSKT